MQSKADIKREQKTRILESLRNAIENGSEQDFSELLQKHIPKPVSIKETYKAGLLHLLVKENRVGMLKEYLTFLANNEYVWNRKDIAFSWKHSEEKTIMQLASDESIQTGNWACFDCLVEHIKNTRNSNSNNKLGLQEVLETILQEAQKKEDPEKSELHEKALALLAIGAYKNKKYKIQETDKTVFHVAARLGDFKLFKNLLNFNTDLYLFDAIV